MSRQWIKVYSDTFAPKVELIKAILEEAQVDAIIINNQDSAYKAIGEIELFVDHLQVVKAKRIIENAL